MTNRQSYFPERPWSHCTSEVDETSDLTDAQYHQFLARTEKDVSVNRMALQEVARERFANMVRALFPAESDTETARLCAEFLGYSDKMVVRWIRKESGAPFDAAFALGCKFGVFRIMELLTLGQSRHIVMRKIAKGVAHVFGK